MSGPLNLERQVRQLERRLRDLPRPAPSDTDEVETSEVIKPFRGTIIDLIDAAGLAGDSWAAWRSFWRAVFALPMDDEDLDRLRRHTAREQAPEAPVSEAVMPIGRRGGKSQNAALGALFLAIRQDHTERLGLGETAVIPVIAADRPQARQVLAYLKGLVRLPAFEDYVSRILRDSVTFRTGVTVQVSTCSYRTTRGYTIVGMIADEIAFWRTDDGAANPDTEVLTALRPGMAMIPDALLLMLSTPYATRGELYRSVERSFGRDDARVLVWNADTRSMNPRVPAAFIEQAFEDDPIAAASEYGRDGRVVFRRDVEVFLDPEAIRAVTVHGRRELSPRPGVRYVAFVDPSGGSQDSMTLAIAHLEAGLGVLDLVRERRPPFPPDDVVEEFCETLRAYRIHSVTGDRYGGEWPRERFRERGIKYVTSERSKSDIYRELVAPVNSGDVALLDLPVLRGQLQGLERRVARGGRDSVDHGPGGHDDVANAAAGALVLACAKPKRRHALIPPSESYFEVPGSTRPWASSTELVAGRHADPNRWWR